jgi:hypothetical protein
MSINISSDNVYGKCDLKCQFMFDYPNTSLVAKNDDMMISLTCDDQSSSPVIFNKKKYNVTKVIIVSPSVHLFNNSQVNAEILIHHTPILGGKSLIVCLPIIESGNSTTSTSLLTEIISAVSSNAPSQGETTQINISNFTLNNIVPKKPFYSYIGNDIHKSQAGFIVYGYLEAIPLSSSTLTSLSNIIKPFPINLKGKSLFYNKDGPNNSFNSDGIYISCQPTGSSGETVTVSNGSNSNDTNYNLGDIGNNPTAQIIMKILLFLIIFIVFFLMINYAYNYFSANPPLIKTLR